VILTSPVEQYLETLPRPADPVLAEMEQHARRDRIPVVLAPTGAMLQVLALARGARRAVEVGTAIGVSTLYIARGLAPGGTIVSFEVDEARHAAARSYLDRAGVLDRADLRLEDARSGLQALEGPFDLAFLDGVKAQYGDYLDALLPLLAPGAVIAVDNTLMSGTVAEGQPDGNWTAEQIARARAFNERLIEDERLFATLLPVGDGLLIAVKR
jgi:predicted O-methyltransferase YrrM